jgi:hypothetical protein
MRLIPNPQIHSRFQLQVLTQRKQRKQRKAVISQAVLCFLCFLCVPGLFTDSVYDKRLRASSVPARLRVTSLPECTHKCRIRYQAPSAPALLAGHAADGTHGQGHDPGTARTYPPRRWRHATYRIASVRLLALDVPIKERYLEDREFRKFHDSVSGPCTNHSRESPGPGNDHGGPRTVDGSITPGWQR